MIRSHFLAVNPAVENQPILAGENMIDRQTDALTVPSGYKTAASSGIHDVALSDQMSEPRGKRGAIKVAQQEHGQVRIPGDISGGPVLGIP